MPDSPGKIAGRLLMRYSPALPTTIRQFTRRAPGRWRRQLRACRWCSSRIMRCMNTSARETCMRQLTLQRWQIFARCPRQRRLPSGRRRVVRGGWGGGGGKGIKGGGGGGKKGKTGKKKRRGENALFKRPKDGEK